MIRFEDLIEKVRASNPEADIELLRRAYVFSAFEHKGQVRHSGDPYLVHPLEVADFLADMRLDVVAVSAGLLHDVVEDTLATPERIAELFGPEIAHVVEGVTKLGAIPFSSSEERQAENLRKMLLAMVDDIRVILVKLADRLHNMRTLGHVPDEKRERIARETLDIYAPIANRLGMSKVKNELEELSFKALEPRAYEDLRDKVDQRRRATQGLIEELRGTILAKLTEAQVPHEADRLAFVALRRDALVLVAPGLAEEGEGAEPSAYTTDLQVACLLPMGILRGTLRVIYNLRLSDHLQHTGHLLTLHRCLLAPYGGTANSPGARGLHSAIVNLNHTLGISECG